MFSLSVSAWRIIELLSVVLFTFYRRRWSRLRRSFAAVTSGQQRVVLDTWELAIAKTGGYLHSRMLLALLSAFFHWITFNRLEPSTDCHGVVGRSRFTILASGGNISRRNIACPVDIFGFSVEGAIRHRLHRHIPTSGELSFAPRITARTMEVHAAVAFGSAVVGGRFLVRSGSTCTTGCGNVAALAGSWGTHHEVIDSPLVHVAESVEGNVVSVKPQTQCKLSWHILISFRGSTARMTVNRYAR